MQNEPKPVPYSGPETAPQTGPDASLQDRLQATPPYSDPAFGPGAAAGNGQPEPGPEPGPETGPAEALGAILAGMNERPPGVHVETFCGHPVEIASDIIARIGLCPRDLVTLATALLCTVSERAAADWPVGGNPFHRIDMEKLNPFQIASAVLQTVDSWGNGGEYPPEESLQPAPVVPH